MNKEREQDGSTEEGTHIVLIERSKEEMCIKRGIPHIKGQEEKWMMAITMGKCFPENRTIAGRREGRMKKNFTPVSIKQN